MHRSTNPIQAPKRQFKIKWAEMAAQVATGLAVGALGVMAFYVATDDATSPAEPTTPACATEDDTNCFWAGDSQGNGQGESFYVDAAGNAYYLPATDATWTNEDCTANLTAWTRDAQQMIEDMDSRWASSAPYTSSVRTDNIDPMTDRLNYILSEVCK